MAFSMAPNSVISQSSQDESSTAPRTNPIYLHWKDNDSVYQSQEIKNSDGRTYIPLSYLATSTMMNAYPESGDNKSLAGRHSCAVVKLSESNEKIVVTPCECTEQSDVFKGYSASHSIKMSALVDTMSKNPLDISTKNFSCVLQKTVTVITKMRIEVSTVDRSILLHNTVLLYSPKQSNFDFEKRSEESIFGNEPLACNKSGTTESGRLSSESQNYIFAAQNALKYERFTKFYNIERKKELSLVDAKYYPKLCRATVLSAHPKSSDSKNPISQNSGLTMRIMYTTKQLTNGSAFVNEKISVILSDSEQSSVCQTLSPRYLKKMPDTLPFPIKFSENVQVGDKQIDFGYGIEIFGDHEGGMNAVFDEKKLDLFVLPTIQTYYDWSESSQSGISGSDQREAKADVQGNALPDEVPRLGSEYASRFAPGESTGSTSLEKTVSIQPSSTHSSSETSTDIGAREFLRQTKRPSEGNPSSSNEGSFVTASDSSSFSSVCDKTIGPSFPPVSGITSKEFPSSSNSSVFDKAANLSVVNVENYSGSCKQSTILNTGYTDTDTRTDHTQFLRSTSSRTTDSAGTARSTATLKVASVASTQATTSAAKSVLTAIEGASKKEAKDLMNSEPEVSTARDSSQRSPNETSSLVERTGRSTLPISPNICGSDQEQDKKQADIGPTFPGAPKLVDFKFRSRKLQSPFEMSAVQRENSAGAVVTKKVNRNTDISITPTWKDIPAKCIKKDSSSQVLEIPVRIDGRLNGKPCRTDVTVRFKKEGTRRPHFSPRRVSLNNRTIWRSYDEIEWSSKSVASREPIFLNSKRWSTV